jgi:hypothetical protein
MPLQTLAQWPPPGRGLVLLHNAKGRAFSQADLERWVRLSRFVFKTPKIDLFHRACDLAVLERLRHATAQLDVRYSVRTTCAAPPPPPQRLRDADVFDVFLTPNQPDAPAFAEWLKCCAEAGVPVRVQFTAPFDGDLDVEKIAGQLAAAPVRVVNVALWDTLHQAEPARNAMHSEVTVQKINALADAIDSESIELNILRVPKSLVETKLQAHAMNPSETLRDFQQYEPHALRAAERLWRLGPGLGGKAILMMLGVHTSTNNPIDARLLPWILDFPWLKARLWAAHKLLRHRTPVLRASAMDEAVDPLPNAQNWEGSGNSTSAADAERFRAALPGLEFTLDHRDFAARELRAHQRPRYVDEIDALRIAQSPEVESLAADANDIVLNRPPDREIASFDYQIEGVWGRQSPGSMGWFSFTNSEKVSTPLATLEPPFTLSYTVGGGIAEFAGFAIGRHARLVCPMVAYAHKIVLHVDAHGAYVLLRDGIPMKPVEFVGEYFAPARLGSRLEPRISLWNIDGSVGTQAVYVWQGGKQPAEQRKAKVSVVMVSTRYARRLQAVLQNLAHQRGIGMDDIEVHVAYVPGIDATGDVLDGLALAHPELRIVKTAFAPEHTTAKGFMLNECIAKAAGDWIVVLDADILLPPTALAALAAMDNGVKFVVPDGRKMLTPQTTARILLGEIEPWSAWDVLVEDAGEYRFREAEGVPLGYCQCVRRECLEQVQYEELNHFEGADWKFGQDMRDAFGPEKRLSGLPVLHLDHGSSNWYGASRHL